VYTWRAGAIMCCDVGDMQLDTWRTGAITCCDVGDMVIGKVA
jgi:hypothetical protein